ncbi:MAG: putative lipoic acid-binding regulatory protein [Pseudohongiellaceae bacterium]
MNQQEPPKIEFPCEDYVIKIMGEASQVMIDFVLKVTEQFAPGFNRESISIKQSSKGKFHSITLFITATGEDQLSAYHKTLIAHDAIKIVL